MIDLNVQSNKDLNFKTYIELENFLKSISDDGLAGEMYSKRKSKDIFNLNYPILIPIPRNIPEEIIHNLSHDGKGKRRYYKEIFKSGGDFDYLLTNDWYEKVDLFI